MTHKNDVNELRETLFDTLRDLKNNKDPADIERAEAISKVAQTIINTAKIEIDHARITGANNTSTFITEQKQVPKIPTANGYIHRIGK